MNRRDKGGDEPSNDGEQIADDLIKAVKKGDAAGVSDALTAYYEYCVKQHESDDEDNKWTAERLRRFEPTVEGIRLDDDHTPILGAGLAEALSRADKKTGDGLAAQIVERHFKGDKKDK